MTVPLRSVLYLPASNPRAVAKARTLAADAIILDLEDAVAPDAKFAARDAAVSAVTAGGFGGMLVVRVNALDTEWGAADLAAVATVRPDAVLLPKVSNPALLIAARAALGLDGPDLWAMIETCAALLDLRAIVAAAAAATRLTALVAGTNDLAAESRARPGPDRAPLLPALALIVTAARAHGLAALDGVCNALDDPSRLAAECAQGRDFGFDGKTLIHPSQIAAANAAFAPDAAEVAWARTVIAAFAAGPDRGVLRIDGRMVERLHLAEADRVVAVADAIAALGGDPGK